MKTEKKFYDFETEGGKGLMFPRNHFINMFNSRTMMGFPFEAGEINSLYGHPYDVYIDSETDSSIWVIGGDAHCHDGDELGKYKEAVVMYCKPEHKNSLIKKIEKVA